MGSKYARGSDSSIHQLVGIAFLSVAIRRRLQSYRRREKCAVPLVTPRHTRDTMRATSDGQAKFSKSFDFYPSRAVRMSTLSETARQ